MNIKATLKAILAGLPGAFALAFLTATVTLILALVFSVTLGNQQDHHRNATRCYAAAQMELIYEVARAANYDIDERRFPIVNTEGIDCDQYVVVEIEQ